MGTDRSISPEKKGDWWGKNTPRGEKKAAEGIETP